MNKVFLVGNLASDVNLSETSSGKNLATFSLAVQNHYNSETKQSIADFFDIVAWDNQANYAYRFLSKGRKVAIMGKLVVNNYTDKNGTQKKVYKIEAKEMELFFGAKKEDDDEQIRMPKAPTRHSNKPTLEVMADGDIPF